MKKFLFVLSLTALVSSARADYESDLDPAGEAEETDEAIYTAEGEAEFYRQYFSPALRDSDFAFRFKFPQTTWLECSDSVTGNYYGSACSNKRGISVALKTFMMTHLEKCVDKAMAAQGGGTLQSLHVEHDGILGDAKHSPKSLHAENRAIDVKAFKITLASGEVRRVVYEGTANRVFYKAFRNCWGDVIKTYDGCPYASGNIMYTGSIGWEDSRHQHHLHTSVPVCSKGKYSGSYFQR